MGDLAGDAVNVRWAVTQTDPAAIRAAVDQAIRGALRDVAGPFQQASNRAYAKTRFAGTFQLTPATITRRVTLFSMNDLIKVVEDPTKPHVIRARNAPWLHFYWQRQGWWVRTLLVHHPGTAGKRYIAPLFEEAGWHLGEALWARIEAINGL